MKQFFIALQFLTILPIKIKARLKKEDYGKALLYFPIVGFIIGAALAAIPSIFGFLPNLVLSAIILISSILITGGIHIDGFADTCDGLYGFNPKEKILEIMRDSRIGVMGVVGVMSLLLLKFALIANIPGNILWKSLIIMGVFSRFAQVLACALSGYARKEGKAKNFIGASGVNELLVATILTITMTLIVMKLGGLVLIALSLLPVLLFINYVKKKISGMTGDTIGATSEIAEIAVLSLATCFY